MKSHWTDHLNVRALLYERRPSLVVECGAGSGENTANLVTARGDLGFRLVVINDDGDPAFGDEMRNNGVDWRSAISYLELQTFGEGAIDFCLIDTDHNYWTLRRELDELWPRMKPGGLCVMHDTGTFGKNNGRQPEYNIKGVPYPHSQIEAADKAGLGMIDAINEDLKSGRWRKVAESDQSHGAIAMERM